MLLKQLFWDQVFHSFIIWSSSISYRIKSYITPILFCTDSFSMVTPTKDEATKKTSKSRIIEEVSPPNGSSSNGHTPLDVHTASFDSHKPSFHNDKLASHFELHSRLGSSVDFSFFISVWQHLFSSRYTFTFIQYPFEYIV